MAAAVRTVAQAVGAIVIAWANFGSHADARSYGPYRRQQTYKVCASPSEATHAAVLIHGGAWASNTYNVPDILRICQKLAAAGLLAVSIDYRLTEDKPWPAQLMDAQLAIREIRRQYGLPTCVVGESAGAQMALMTGLVSTVHDPAVDQADEADLLPNQSSMPTCVVSWSAPTNLSGLYLAPRTSPVVRRALEHLVRGDPLPIEEALSAASPIHQASLGASPPTFLVHGLHDRIVPVAQAESYFRALEATRGQQSEDKFIETDGGHVLGGLDNAEIDAILAHIAGFIGRFRRYEDPSRQ